MMLMLQMHVEQNTVLVLKIHVHSYHMIVQIVNIKYTRLLASFLLHVTRLS